MTLFFKLLKKKHEGKENWQYSTRRKTKNMPEDQRIAPISTFDSLYFRLYTRDRKL